MQLIGIILIRFLVGVHLAFSEAKAVVDKEER